VSNWLVVAGAVGVAGALLGLVGVGAASVTRGHWGTALVCMAAFASILFLLLWGIEYATDFWEGK
jgi:hypothetical protein